MTAVKALLYVLMAVAGSSAAVFTADGWAGSAWWNVLVLGVGALGVWWKANTPTQPWAKFLISVFTAGAAVLVSAWTDRRIDPVEVQQIVLAVLGAAMVGAGQNNVTTPGPRYDTGSVRTRMALIVSAAGILVLALGLLAGDVANAHAPHRSPAATVTVTSSFVCSGALTVFFTASYRDGTPRLDDGRAVLELHEVSGRSQGPDFLGTWYRLSTKSGGEGALRYEGWTHSTEYGAHWADARVTVAGVTSPAAPLNTGCPA